ncbi:MAG: phosphoribosylamine--glycine ligase [Candidatus Paceibacterota bacterium]|jgi:phosphoribosylamine--glycine ligase
MDVLITGSGGREHALAWKLKQSKKVKNIFVATGNAGTSKIAKNIDASNVEEIIGWLENNPVDLVIIGPDSHLSLGIVDKLEDLGIKVFGPTKAASEIEWSKSFAKKFMKEEGIPTASYEIFSNIKKAKSYIKKQSFPLVIKASGLAFGKGVVIAKSLKEAEDALREIMSDKIFGEAGNEVVIEEYLQGKEISIHAFCDGKNAVLFPSAQDHKSIFDNDKGPNTGGMGTIAPVPWVTREQMKEIEDMVVIPTIKALERRGKPFKGILFPGIMITKSGPKVIEFNARFGDPETQSYMRILETDLIDIILACIHGNIKDQNIKWSPKSACCVVCASGGYPNKYENGKIISGLDLNEDAFVFHAGTKSDGKNIVTNGGRVLGVTAVGNNLKESLGKAYKAIKLISFEGMQYRKDIGLKSL